MRAESFFSIVIDSWQIYLISIAISAFITYIVTKKYFNSYIDPLFLHLIGVVFANAVPLFLLLIDEISQINFWSFFILESFFWIGFLRNSRRNIICDNSQNADYFKLFKYSSFFVVLFQVIYYSKQGFPIFFESRIDKYNGAESGLGLLERLTTVMKMYCIIYSFYNINSIQYKEKLLSRLFLSFMLFTFFMSGAKSAFFGLVTPYFFYLYYIKNKSLSLIKFAYLGVLMLIVGALVLLVASNGDNQTSPFLVLIRRFGMYGDIYYEAYGNNVISSVKINTPFRDLFVGLLAPFRIVDYNWASDLVPSMQIHHVSYPELEGIKLGPNNRPPVVYYTFWGLFGGSIASYITGFLTSYFMFNSLKCFKKNIVGISIYACLYMTFCSFIYDPILAMGYIPNFIIGFVFFRFIELLIHSNSKRSLVYGNS